MKKEEAEEVEDVEIPYSWRSFGIPAGKVIIGIIAVGVIALVVVANAVYTPGSQSDVELGQKVAKVYDPNKSFVSQDDVPVPDETNTAGQANAPDQPSAPEEGVGAEQTTVQEQADAQSENSGGSMFSSSIIPQRLIDAGVIPVPGDVGVLYLTFKSNNTVHINNTNTLTTGYIGDSDVTMEDGRLVFSMVYNKGTDRERATTFYAIFDDPVLSITSPSYNPMHYMLR